MDGIKKAQPKKQSVAQPVVSRSHSTKKVAYKKTIEPKRKKVFKRKKQFDFGIFFNENIVTIARRYPVVTASSFLLIVSVSAGLFSVINKPAEAVGPIKKIPEFYTMPLEVSLGQDMLTVQPLSGNNTQVTQEGNRYTYTEAYVNTDVVQTNYDYKVKEEIIFRSPGHPTVFKYELGNLENFVVEEDADGNFMFHNRELYEELGEFTQLSRVFTIPTPFVEDVRKIRSFSAVTTVLDEESGIITISVDPLWIETATYPITLDPTVEINILNLHSHPSRGQNWVVDFTTEGAADLYIIPDDQATIDDDEYISLTCDGDHRSAIIKEGDVIFYPDWECDGVGQVTHYTLKAGKHTLRFEFGDQVAYAYNANTAGDYMVRRNDSNTDGITTSDYTSLWDTHVASSGSSISYSAGTFTLASGKYLVMWGERIDGDDTDATNNQRTEVQGRLEIGGTATTTAAGQIYHRNGETSCPTDCAHQGFLSGSGILQIESDDTDVILNIYRTDNTGASIDVDRVPDWGGITFIALDDSWNYARYRRTSDVEVPDAFADVVWQHAVEEDTGFSQSSGEITITNAGRYLVAYSLPINYNSGGRTEYVSRITLTDSEVTGTRTSTYIRSSQSTNDGVLSYVGVIDVGASAVLAVESDRTDGTSSDLLSGSNIQIWQLPAAAETFIVEATATGDMDPSSMTEYTWETTPHIDTDGFTDTSDTDSIIEPAEDGDYLFFASMATTNGEVRRVSSGRFSINDTATTTGVGGQYNRSSGADDAGWSFGTLLTNLTAGDDISLETQGHADLTGSQEPDYAAMSGIRLASIFSSNATPAISSVTDTPDPSNPQQTVTFSVDWSDADAGDNIKAKVCSTDSLTNQNCDGTTYATSSSFTTSDPEDITYVTSGDDAGSNNYFTFVCDDDAACSTSTSGTFTVNATSSITSVVDTPDPTNPGRSVSFIVDWADSGDAVKAKVCKTDSLSNQDCGGGFWASSSAYTTQDPLSVWYDVLGADAGQTRSYYVFICDDNGLCTDTSTSGTFVVNSVSTIPNVIFR